MTDQKLSNSIALGPVVVPGRVWLAPMTGVSDLPFRQIAASLGAPYVATEMVASEDFAAGRPESVRRAAVGSGLPLMVVQLVGADPRAVHGAAMLAADAGAHLIDLNFGCPAKSVTGLACGSALMRDLDLAQRLIEAALEGSRRPVTIKMRLGWDDTVKNAPELALRAQRVGAAGLTVHGRTRQQFYSGCADWSAVREVRDAVTLPVIVNGDIVDGSSAREALARSGADGVMIGRGAIGRPWIAAGIQNEVEGADADGRAMERRLGLVIEHLSANVRFYGERLGVLKFRKHLAAYIEHAPWPHAAPDRRAARARLCRLERAGEVERALAGLWSRGDGRLAA